MENYSPEIVEIATHILGEEWEAAHEKSFAFLQKEPENIEAIVFFVYASAYGGFFKMQ